MKKLVTSNITTSVGMPLKAGTLNHVQSAYQESLDALAKKTLSIESSGSTTPYKIWGINYSLVGSTVTISQGALYIGTEIFQVDATSFT